MGCYGGHSGPYRIEPELVGDKKQVRFSGMWYGLNALYTLPRHITSIRNNSLLTPQDLNQLHERAKKCYPNYRGTG